MSKSLIYHPTQPPKGWRWLKEGDTIRATDEYHYCSIQKINKALPEEVGNRVTASVISREGTIGQYIRRIVKRRKPKD